MDPQQGWQLDLGSEAERRADDEASRFVVGMDLPDVATVPADCEAPVGERLNCDVAMFSDLRANYEVRLSPTDSNVWLGPTRSRARAWVGAGAPRRQSV